MGRKPAATFFSILALVSIIIVAMGAFFFFYQNPRQAEKLYGTPSDEINSIQRLYYANRLVSNQDQLNQPHNPFQEQISFSIRVGESPQDITNRLQQLGLIPDAGALRDYLVYTGIDTALQAGDYLFSAQMTPVEIADRMHGSSPGEASLLILPGWRLEEIAEALPTTGLSIPPENFLEIVNNPPAGLMVSNFLLSGATLEGFLSPGTYLLPRQTSVDELVVFLTNNFFAQITGEMLTGFQEQGLNLFQAVTLASIIEREAVLEEEMPLIASVFLNRLAEGMKLESDPTVQYAIGYHLRGETWWKNPLLLEDLKYESPYNTYLYPELPPGPISIPSPAAIEAVASPADTPYFYFRATCDSSGRHFFARTFEEHVQNACTE